MSAPIAFVDCETTGVHPGRRPWEIAIIRREPDGQERTCVIQIDDVDLAEADPFGLRVGGFYERYWRYAKGTPESPHQLVLPELNTAHVVEELTRGAHLVGIVPNFDAETFDAMLRRHKLIPAWHYHLIDVEAMAVGYLSGSLHACQAEVDQHATNPVLTLPWKSDQLSLECGVTPPSEEDRHTALGDALWAQRWYDAITRGTS